MIDARDLFSKTADLDVLCRTLEKYGVVAVPDFVPRSLVAKLLHEAEIATTRYANYKNPFGPCSRFSLSELPAALSRSRDHIHGGHLEALPDLFPRSKDLLGSGFFRALTQMYLGPLCGFMEVVAFGKDCIPDQTAVYGKLHFDRRHQLKAIIYLNDVDSQNGAFGCIPGSHALGRQLFRACWREVLQIDSDEEQWIDIAAAAVAEDDPTYRLVPSVQENTSWVRSLGQRIPIIGEAGTLVIFDTHLLHYGGFVREAGRVRWTLKGHTFAVGNLNQIMADDKQQETSAA